MSDSPAESSEALGGPIAVSVEAMFGAHTRKPFVRMEAPGIPLMLTPDEAREIAANLTFAAFAAEADGTLVSFITDRIGAPMEAAAAMLARLRAHRAGEPIPPGEAPADDPDDPENKGATP